MSKKLSPIISATYYTYSISVTSLGPQRSAQVLISQHYMEEKEREEMGQTQEEDITEKRDELMSDYEEDYDHWSTRASFDQFSLSGSKVR